MSEPVGNAPRNADVPGNSHKGRERPLPMKPESGEPIEPAKRIITGPVKKKKQSFLKRISSRFFVDDAQSIGDFIIDQVIVPGLKNLFRDTAVGSLDRALYGTARNRGRSMLGERDGFRTRYDLMGDREPDRRSISREGRARHDFDEIVLGSYEEAVEVIEAMIERLGRYGFVSVADMYTFLGVTGSHADQRWGWHNLQTADVRQTRGGFLLDLPRPEPMR